MNNTLPVLKIVFTTFALIFAGERAVMGANCKATGISAASVDTVNGPWTCHINDASDKVQMVASATDSDSNDSEAGCNCGDGNNIDLAATTWVINSGVLDSPTGAANSWKAGASTGHKTLTVTFKDNASNPDCDDGDREVQKSLTAFKVGIHLTCEALSYTRWEGEGDEPIYGDLKLEKSLGGSGSGSWSAEEADNSIATWTLSCYPQGTSMKQNIHGRASAKSYVDPDFPENDCKLYGKTTDTDFDGVGPSSLVDIEISLGYVGITPHLSTSGDETVAALGAGAGFASTLHTELSKKIELVSSTTVGPSATKDIAHDAGEKHLIGKEGKSANAEWEIRYEMSIVSGVGNSANSEVKIAMMYEWGTGFSSPSYGP